MAPHERPQTKGVVLPWKQGSRPLVWRGLIHQVFSQVLPSLPVWVSAGATKGTAGRYGAWASLLRAVAVPKEMAVGSKVPQPSPKGLLYCQPGRSGGHVLGPGSSTCDNSTCSSTLAQLQVSREAHLCLPEVTSLGGHCVSPTLVG